MPDKCVCSFGRCCGSKPATEDDGPPAAAARPAQVAHEQVMMIQDISLDLTVVSAPHRLLRTISETPPDDEPWDYMTVDPDRKLVMLAGQRFLGFAGIHQAEFAERPDACRGRTIADVFPRGILDIFTPLLDFALGGENGQLHSIFKGQGLTFFAYPFHNENKEVIGVHIVYRPTRYDASDIAALISRGPGSPAPTSTPPPAAAFGRRGISGI